MFIHNNGKVHVVCALRCGHTSMKSHFGITDHKPKSDDWIDWIQSKTRRVLVLRNPLDRWMSAEVFRNVDWEAKGWADIFADRKFMDKELFIHKHREAFLFNIPKDLDFEIIPFENLNEYLQVAKATQVTNSSNVTEDQVPMDPKMRTELAQYRYFRENCSVISPKEWKELTQS